MLRDVLALQLAAVGPDKRQESLAVEDGAEPVLG
jgi:hypothetical protein